MGDSLHKVYGKEAISILQNSMIKDMNLPPFIEEVEHDDDKGEPFHANHRHFKNKKNGKIVKVSLCDQKGFIQAVEFMQGAFKGIND